MFQRIETIAERILVGMHTTMSFANDKSPSLWQTFMPRLKVVNEKVGSELYSVEIYDTDFFRNFNPTNEFDKWAAIRVSDSRAIPTGMEILVVPKGLYAIFLHQGPASAAAQTYSYIFETWLPASDYHLDHRPHFAVMGEKYNMKIRNQKKRFGSRLKKNKIAFS